MVKASELRKGNLISIGENVIVVNAIDEDGINGRWAPEGIYYDYEFNSIRPCAGIPLSPEILQEWCGFAKDRFYDTDTYSIGDLTVIYEDGFYIGLPYYNEPYTPFGVELKHLHQLQNLYFSLTAEELSIKIPQTA